MKSILLVAHGSKAKATEQAFDKILGMVRAKLPELVIEAAYMQLSDKTLDLAVADLAERGATAIRIVPFFLFTGMHIQKDIPEMIEEFAQQYPHIEFSLANTLGTDERLADILVDRIKEA